MTAPDPSALDPLYREAMEFARELITLIKYAEECGADPDGHDIRGQIRQHVREATPAHVWLLIDVLARSVAATFDDLAEWSEYAIQSVAAAESEEDES